MKRVCAFFLIISLVLGVVSFVPEAKAATHTHHCYCTGNGQPDHVCEESAQWTAVTGSLTAADGEYYYLENNTVAAITVRDGATATLCLNGKTVRAQCTIMVYSGGVLNVCDCVGSGVIKATNPGNSSNAKGSAVLISSSTNGFGTLNLYSGTITGVTTTSGVTCRAVEVKGGVFNMYGGRIEKGLTDGSLESDKKSGYGGNVCVYKEGINEGSFTMYGGVISGGTARLADGSNGYGGNVFGGQGTHIAIYGGTLENGSSVRGGNIYSTADISIEGATITGGSADLYRGNVYISGTVDLSKNTITGGSAGGKAETVRMIRDEVYLVSDHTSLGDAVAKLGSDAVHLQLLGDVTEIRTLDLDITMDLNGHNLSGVTIAAKFYGMDSAEIPGKLSCTLKNGRIIALDEYVLIDEGSGVYSFHTFTDTATHISLHPAKGAMGYKYKLELPESVKKQVTHCGFDMWLEGYGVRSYSKPIDQCGEELTLRLNNILSADYTQTENAVNVETPIHARPFVILENGTKIEMKEVAYTFHDALEAADNRYDEYNQAQQTALNTLFQEHNYLIKYWNVENFHHIKTGTWTDLSSKGLQNLIWQNKLSGTYRLTQDVDLGSSTITLKEGQNLTLCLDGHNITGTKQLFRVEGGSLTICDCHYGGKDPGVLTSTLTGESGVFAPVAQLTGNGVMNLYGGELKGTNLVRSAGVVAVGHQTQASNATFNLYNGSISDGKAVYNGGLLNVWHGSTFNMYGGALYNGTCTGDGGGVVVRDGSNANLYGGEIYNCVSGNNGGGLWTQNGGTCYLGQVKIYNNTAAKKGGNVFNNGTPNFTIDGATVTGGIAKEAGGVYQHTGQIRVTGGSIVRNNTNDDLLIHRLASLNADGLTQGADVQYSAYSHGKVGTDPAIVKYLTCVDEGYSIRQENGDMVVWLDKDLCRQQALTEFSVGYGKSCINPKENNVPLAGYGDTDERCSTTIDGDLYVTATAITDESGKTVLLMAVDLINMSDTDLAPYLSQISTMTGVPENQIIVNFSHTHSAPSITFSTPIITRYNKMLPDLFAQAAMDAMNDRKPATMESGSFDVEGLNFTRHYMYQDANGIWQYSCDNFGERDLDNQTNAQHTTDWDKTMHLVRFTQNDGHQILMVNWRAHPCLTGGPNKTVVSSDYVGALRDCFSAENVDMIFFQGAGGNINAVSRLQSEKHGLDFHAYAEDLHRQIKTAMGDCMQSQQAGLWQVDNYSYTATVDHSDDARYEEAVAFQTKYYETFPGNQEVQAERLQWCADKGWYCVFEASSIIRRHNMGQTQQISLNTLALGKSLAFFTAPGELFDTVSVEVENESSFDMTFCLGYSMGNSKYFAYDPNTPDGSLTYVVYECFNRNFVPGTIKDMIAYWVDTLDRLYAQS